MRAAAHKVQGAGAVEGNAGLAGGGVRRRRGGFGQRLRFLFRRGGYCVTPSHFSYHRAFCAGVPGRGAARRL